MGVSTLGVTNSAPASRRPVTTTAQHSGMDVAALDLGSNSFHLLVARVRGGLPPEKLTSSKETLRFGESVHRTGSIAEDKFARGISTLETMLAIARSFGCERIAAVGTSALRDASNGAAFLEKARQRCGIGVDLLSGDEEAELVYRGVSSASYDLPARLGIVDIGGGSVEIAAGQSQVCELVRSLPLGFLRFGRVQGIAESRAVTAKVNAGAADAVHWLRAYRPNGWVFTGGTARAFDGVARRLYPASAPALSAVSVQRVATAVAVADSGRLRELGVPVARLETFAAGVAVLAALVEQVGAPSIRICRAGLREGVVAREIEAAERERLELGRSRRALAASPLGVSV